MFLLVQLWLGQVHSILGHPVQLGSLLVRREDNRCMCGPQRSWSRPEEGGADQGTLNDGRRTWLQPQCHGSRCHSAHGSWIEGVGQEPCRQGLGQMLLQGQFSLKPKTKDIFSLNRSESLKSCQKLCEAVHNNAVLRDAVTMLTF